MIFNVFRKGTNPTNQVLSTQDLERILRRGAATASGAAVTPETAARFGAVFSCVRVRAESIGQLPLHFYEQKDRLKRKAVEHPLYGLLHDAPNEQTTSQEFWEWVSACLDLRGNAYAFINRPIAGGDIYELLQLDPTWVDVKVDAKRDIYYMVRFPTSEGTFTAAKRYDRDAILHFKLMSLNGVVGASVIEQARETIGLGMALEKHGATFFKNGATVNGVLQTDQVLNDDVFKEIQDRWEDAHTGLENAHRTAILEAGLKWQSVTMPLKDAQFLEGRKFQRNDIAGLFRVPPHFLGDLERATFSNIEQQGLDFVVHGLMPGLVRIEQRIKLQLLSKEDRRRYFAKFNAAGLARGDMTARSAYYMNMIQNGAISPNEIRELEDMNPRDGGDVYLTPMNMTVTPAPPGAPPEPADTPNDSTGG